MVAAAKKNIMTNAVRQLRRQTLNQVRNGSMGLVVYGNQSEGYRLGGERPNSVVLFSRPFPLQREAIAHGQERYGKTAKRVTKPVAAKAA
jgi:hypothetical protein